jgi:hypothetical protein
LHFGTQLAAAMRAEGSQWQVVRTVAIRQADQQVTIGLPSAKLVRRRSDSLRERHQAAC